MRKLSIAIILCYLALWFSFPAFAIERDEILDPEEAFQLSAEVKNAKSLILSWNIADGYYLYLHKFKFSSLTPGIETGTAIFPEGLPKHDQFFGDVEIFHGRLNVELPIQRKDQKIRKFNLEVIFQGCAEIGVCYMPITKELIFDLPDDDAAANAGSLDSDYKPAGFMSEQDQIASSMTKNSFGFITLSFMGFGLLLSFTPCVFPMIPILSGIVVGQGSGISTSKAFALSFSYVLASALTYMIFGVMAGLFGSNLQAFFQEPKVIAGFSGIFVLLALSMFGMFNFQLPAVIQTRIAVLSARQKKGSWLGAAIMGMLSALVIGPCVTAPLAGALIYIGKSGDAFLGGAALFALGFGMGLPMLIIGTSAGKLLPKVGPWLEVTKAVFGWGLLAVAVWLLGRILPTSVTMQLWGALLFVPFIYLGWKKLWKTAVAIALLYGIFLLVGIFTHRQRDYMALLCEAAVACEGQASLPFQRIESVNELEQVLADAKAKSRWVMLDFYADWCVACRELERHTFSDARVKSALSEWDLVQANVTKNDPLDKSMLKEFDLIGPPAVLFFGPDLQERKAYRIVGYIDSDEFLARLNKLTE